MPKASKKEQIRAANARYRALRRVLIDAHKDVPCAHCGERYPSCVMDVHHPPGVEKPYGGSSIWRWAISVSVADLAEHLELLEVLCANCHRIHHFANEEGK